MRHDGVNCNTISTMPEQCIFRLCNISNETIPFQIITDSKVGVLPKYQLKMDFIITAHTILSTQFIMYENRLNLYNFDKLDENAKIFNCLIPNLNIWFKNSNFSFLNGEKLLCTNAIN